MIMATIVRAVQTCSACPSQWNAWDSDGNYWYLHYRSGHGRAEMRESPYWETWDVIPQSYREFDTGDSLDGSIGLEEFCQLVGLGLELEN